MAIPCPWRHNKGHLNLLQDPAIYLIPINTPPAYLADLAGNMAAESAHTDNQTQLKAWETYIIIRTITHRMIAKAIDNVYYTELNDPLEGLNGVSIWQLISHICNNYAQISQPKINANMSDFHQGIDAALPLAVYMPKQECCQTFALDTGVPISKAKSRPAMSQDQVMDTRYLSFMEWQK